MQGAGGATKNGSERVRTMTRRHPGSRTLAAMSDFKKLVAWQNAVELWRDLLATFTVSKAAVAPGLRAQILKAASSIRSTLAEGSGKDSRREMKRFAEMAYASAKEIEDQLLQGRDAGVMSQQVYVRLEQRRDAVAKLCYGLMRMEDD